jgi:cyclic pyranopterin phosphate synthase
MLAKVEGIDDISLTTNGSLLTREKARTLRDAGLRRLNVSLDALDDETFHAINDVSLPVSRVLDAIDNAAAAGLSPVKVNMVVKAGLNEGDIVPMARQFRETPHIVRFIEFMDVGCTNGWRMDDVVPAREIVARIHKEFPLRPVDPNYPGEVARRWRYLDGGGEIGVIASVTEPFCGGCGRARLSASGSLYTCLFATGGHDLRAMLRSGGSDTEILDCLRAIWSRRTDRYSEIRGEQTDRPLSRVEMSHIGG